MYFAPGEHPPPHFHVYYAEYTATVDIRTCELIEGNLPKKQLKRNYSVPLFEKEGLGEILLDKSPSIPLFQRGR